MKEEFLNQFDHLWRTFRKIVADFDEKALRTSGVGQTVPLGLSFHILGSTKFYIQDTDTPLKLKNGEILPGPEEKPNENDEPPNSEDIQFMIDDLKAKTKKWLLELDFDAKNEKFEWTGKSQGSVALFLLRHSQYHLGEMNALLNIHLDGKADDYFGKLV